MNWLARKFWVDGGCNNQHLRVNRHAYGSVSDGSDVIRFEFPLSYTSNEAEYRTLIALLSLLYDNSGATVCTDSSLMIGQLTQNWRVKAKNLKPLVEIAKKQMERTKVVLVKIPRKENVKMLGH